MTVRARPLRLVAAALVCALAACAGTAPDAPAPEPPHPIGGDRDAHGCLVAAGYAWCERERACVRPWELAQAKGFENSASGYDAWCNAHPVSAP